MPLAASAAPAASPADAGPTVVTFRVARQTYALPLAAVLQVVRLPALTPVPDAPPGQVGLLNLRGRFLPVLDARAVLGHPPAATLDSHVIVLPTAGLLVDAVDDVERFPPDGFVPVAGAGGLVLGMLRERDRAAVALDPEAIAARAAG